jgi:tetratricopeptide (TPR) repeat protein
MHDVRGIERLRRRPDLLYVCAALVLAVALYAPTLRHGIVNYDDPWLIADNWILQHPSTTALRTIAFDTTADTRAVLGAEYLPVRDVSVMFDIAVWGDNYSGHHLTNLLLYLAAIALWFMALGRFGIDRTIAGLAILIWAVHPAHAESVAWLAERKGLLGMVTSGVVALAYANYRSGRSYAWLALAVVIAPLAVWSKALAAFAIASLAGLEWLLPDRRITWRRSLVGLAAIAMATLAAFVPVLIVAARMNVVETHGAAGSWLGTVFGLFGFYLKLAAMMFPNSVAYPISTDGPSTSDIVFGIVGLAATLAIIFVRTQGRWRASPALRVGAMLWLVGWFPVSRLVLPVRLVLAADRYLLLPSLGFALMLAVAIYAVRKPRLRATLASAVIIAAAARSLDAQANWRTARTLWRQAVVSSPRDGDAWSQYVEALASEGDRDEAQRVVEEGLEHVSAPRLMMHQALIYARTGDNVQARVWMARAAENGEPRAMANLALMLVDEHRTDEAVVWAKRAIALMPRYANAYRALGRAELASRNAADAYDAFKRARELEPQAMVNEYNLALALIALGRRDEARVYLQRCLADPVLADRARALLTQ